jgi:glutathione S-transferase
MTLRVVGKLASINVRKVLWTCAELDLPIEHVLSDAELLAANPNRLVPVLRDGELVLWESNSICRHLARTRPKHDLLPEDPVRRALTEQWMDWQATELNSAWRYAFMALVRQSPAHQDATAIKDSIANWNRLMGLLDAHFAHGGGFVTGEHFTLADVVLGLATHRWFLSPIERPHLDAVHAWYQRLTVRPAFRSHGSLMEA